MRIDNLTEQNLLGTYKRLKKTTKRFSKLIVRDPIDFVDFEIDLLNNIRFLISRIETNNYIPGKPVFHNSPKSKGVNRPTVVLEIFDAIVYRFCIEQIEDELLIKTRQKNIRGGIKITRNLKSKDPDDFYEKWFKDWTEHQENLRKSLSHKPFLLTTDIASYFENINLLILKDSIRSEVVGKRELLNLLFYFLENTRNRQDYEVNTFNGLLQEDIDTSRLLAYYFLRSHDENMARFCSDNKAEYYRFVDDMSVTIESEVMGRKALKTMTESLRKLNLVSSIEKTEIIHTKEAQQALFFSENDKLDSLQESLYEHIVLKKSIKGVNSRIENYYKKLKRKGKESYKNWYKILKRFYTLASVGGFDLFSDEIKSQLLRYPSLFSDTKIIKYVLKQDDKILNKIVKIFVLYLYSEENLYQQLETNITELFLSIPIDRFNVDNLHLFSKLSIDIYDRTKNYKPLSDYVRGLATLMIYKFNNAEIDHVADSYLKNKIEDPILRKYVIFTALVTNRHIIRGKVLSKAKKEQDLSIQRLINIVDNASTVINNNLVKNFAKNTSVYVLYDPKKKLKILESYDNVRSRVLNELLNIYS